MSPETNILAPVPEEALPPQDEGTDVIPLPQELITPEAPRIDSLIEESVPALYGIRRFVRAARLAWSEETLKSAKVRQENARAVLHGRLPASGFEPVTRSNRRSALRDSRRRVRIVNHVAGQTSVFGSTDALGRPFQIEDNESVITNEGRPVYDHRIASIDKNTGKAIWEVYVNRAGDEDRDMHAKPFEVKDAAGEYSFSSPAPRPHDLGNKEAQKQRLESGHYHASDKRADLRAGRQYRKHGRKADRRLGKFQKKIEGDKRFERLNNRIESHQQRLQELRELEPLVIQERERKRRARAEARRSAADKTKRTVRAVGRGVLKAAEVTVKVTGKAAKEVGKATYNVSKVAAKATQEHVQATKTAYQEGRAGTVVTDSPVQRKIDSAARLSGRTYARARAKLPGR